MKTLVDHDTLRSDPAIQTAVDRDQPLASSPTLIRFENWTDPSMLRQISSILVESFIDSHPQPPKQLILDFDATDDPVHGGQLGAFFHGYNDHYCFLPLYVFAAKNFWWLIFGPAMWMALTTAGRFYRCWSSACGRPGHRFALSSEAAAVFAASGCFLVRSPPDRLYRIAKNSRLDQDSELLQVMAAILYERSGQKQRLFGDFRYAARSWKNRRRIIVKAEHTALGANPRYVVTSLSGDPQILYDELYCARGEAENRIKEQQLYLYADRTSCMNWLPNQLRVCCRPWPIPCLRGLETARWRHRSGTGPAVTPSA